MELFSAGRVCVWSGIAGAASADSLVVVELLLLLLVLLLLLLDGAGLGAW